MVEKWRYIGCEKIHIVFQKAIMANAIHIAIIFLFSVNKKIS